MPNAAQMATYNYVRSKIARLRGPQSHVPLSLDRVTSLEDHGDRAIFRVDGARVFITQFGNVSSSSGANAGLPDCPTYASGLGLLPAVAADLLVSGNPHKRFLHSQSHTPDTFVGYLLYGTVLQANQLHGAKRKPVRMGQERRAGAGASDRLNTPNPYNFVLQFPPSEIPELVSRRLTNVDQDRAFEAGRRIAGGDYSRENLNLVVAWKMEGVHLTRVMSYLEQNTDADIENALRSALACEDERTAIELLDGLHGVGVPVASAILTTINPEKYTIIDIYALTSLGISDAPTGSVDYYLAYLRKCRELAQQFGISLRTLDHALWQWGYENRSGRGRQELQATALTKV